MDLADGLKRIDWKLPLPLGEGWVEGAKVSAKDFFVSSVLHDNIRLMLSQPMPLSPTLSQREREISAAPKLTLTSTMTVKKK